MRLFQSWPAPMACVCVVLAGCATEAVGGGCRRASEQEIAALFDRWNASLQTGDPHQVVANYAARSILLPTVSNVPRLTPADKEEYFQHFLQNRPFGKIDLRFVDSAVESLGPLLTTPTLVVGKLIAVVLKASTTPCAVMWSDAT